MMKTINPIPIPFIKPLRKSGILIKLPIFIRTKPKISIPKNFKYCLFIIKLFFKVIDFIYKFFYVYKRIFIKHWFNYKP